MKLCQITPCPYKVIVNLKILRAWFPDVINIHIKGKDVISIYNNSFRDLLSLDWSGDILKLKRGPFLVDEVGLRWWPRHVRSCQSPDLVNRNVRGRTSLAQHCSDIWSSLTGGRGLSVQSGRSQHEVLPGVPPPPPVALQLNLSPRSSGGRNGEVSTAAHCSAHTTR